MATCDYTLGAAPASDRSRELWLQHAVGFILFEDMRRYATERIDPKLPAKARAAVQKGIDDAMYGLMMIIDGDSGTLENDSERVELRVIARHVGTGKKGKPVVLNELDLAEGDGMCLGYHGWREGDFGSDPVAQKRE